MTARAVICFPTFLGIVLDEDGKRYSIDLFDDENMIMETTDDLTNILPHTRGVSFFLEYIENAGVYPFKALKEKVSQMQDRSTCVEAFAELLHYGVTLGERAGISNTATDKLALPHVREWFTKVSAVAALPPDTFHTGTGD